MKCHVFSSFLGDAKARFSHIFLMSVSSLVCLRFYKVVRSGFNAYLCFYSSFFLMKSVRNYIIPPVTILTYLLNRPYSYIWSHNHNGCKFYASDLTNKVTEPTSQFPLTSINTSFSENFLLDFIFGPKLRSFNLDEN